MDNLKNILPAKTMSSLEIASLTGKAHYNVLRDIKEQIFAGLYDLKDDSDLSYQSIQGLTVVIDAQTNRIKEILLDKYHADVLVSGYSIKYRAAIINRWQELENKPLTIVDYARALVESHDRIVRLEAEQKHTAKVIEQVVDDVRWLEDRLEKEFENKKLYGWRQ